MHTPSSAARATGVTKSTIYRAIKAGRLPSHSGKYAIYPAELRRPFPSAPPLSRLASAASTNNLASHDGMSAELRRLSYQAPRSGIKVQLCALCVIIVQQFVANLCWLGPNPSIGRLLSGGRREEGWACRATQLTARIKPPTARDE